jgi:hypothetical protein
MDLFTIICGIIMVVFSIIWFVMAYKNIMKNDTFLVVLNSSTGILMLIGTFFILSKYINFYLFVSIIIVYIVINLINLITLKIKLNKNS